ncbi:hypothetical protein ACIBI9_15975 [Nonomuraea sp. NPDC050451]|uniref:hypothetical protein n=1 Tax=Nonomuraea sp. NPDC050451 TaxID=3364364 RepID=UPI0037BA3CDA
MIDYLVADVAEEKLRRHPGNVDAVINLALRGELLIAAARAIQPGGRLLSGYSVKRAGRKFGDGLRWVAALGQGMIACGARAAAVELPGDIDGAV